ncbi:MAG: DUF4926 domain-containing protein [Anaerolineae bacterium]
MKRPELYQRIMLKRDVPEENLKTGDLAWLIDYVPHPGGGEEGAVLEVFNILGDSVAVVTVPVSTIGLLQAEFIPSARVRA